MPKIAGESVCCGRRETHEAVEATPSGGQKYFRFSGLIDY
jgi:hypothetical protein